MSAKIAVVLAMLLALSGWALYKQISANGAMQTQLAQREQQLQDATKHVDALAAEIKARDEAVILLEAERDDLRKKTAQVRTVIRKVYVQPDVQAWADTVPPPAVVDAVGACIELLWKHSAVNGNADCGAVASGRDYAGLPAP